MSFTQVEDQEFVRNLRTLETKFFSSDIYNLSSNSLIGISYLLVKMLQRYRETFKQSPYEPVQFYIYTLVYFDIAKQRVADNTAMMDRILANMDSILGLAAVIQSTPVLEEWEPET